MVNVLSIMIATLVAGTGIDVHSATGCPSSDAIRAKLDPLLAVVDADDTAWVDIAAPGPTGESELHVRLVRSDSSIVGERRLLVQGTCDEMADTVATVLAVWETPQVLQPPATVDAVASTAPIPQPEGSRPRRIDLRIGAGGGAGFVGGAAATGSLELRARWSALPLQTRIAVTGQTHREDNLDPGSVAWRRTYLSVGLGWEKKPAPTPHWQASADADVLVGRLTVSGRGFSPNRTQDAVELGASAAFRGEWVFDAWSVWLEGRACLWPRPQRAVLSNSSSSTAPLPGFDLLATVGVSRFVLR